MKLSPTSNLSGYLNIKTATSPPSPFLRFPTLWQGSRTRRTQSQNKGTRAERCSSMKKARGDLVLVARRHRCLCFMMVITLLYALFVCFQFPLIFRAGTRIAVLNSGGAFQRPSVLMSEEDLAEMESPTRPRVVPFRVIQKSFSPLQRPVREFEATVSGLMFPETVRNGSDPNQGFSELQASAREAWEVGRRLWEDISSGSSAETDEYEKNGESKEVSCPHSIALTGEELSDLGNVVKLPCGLTVGSHITIIGKPNAAHADFNPKISTVKEGSDSVMVSQFMVELQGLKIADGEEPPKIMHFNPRLKGDWSGMPVIEQNTCYRMQWGQSQRCEGWKSNADEETVEGQVKCEKWIRKDGNHSSEESTTRWWLNRLIGRTKKVSVDWPYPFAEEKFFVLTLSAGLEGYHFFVDGRHVSSFPYRTGFTLEDATGLSVNGDLHVHSIFAGSLPTLRPSFAPQRHLEMSNEWQAPALPDGPVEFFIGILSASNHFTERMAVRKSWMQARLIKSSNVVARFFVALNGRKEVNEELKKEAEFFGDIVIVPFVDNYDLIVLKTTAICEYGVRTVSAKYVLKCDDDTFVRLESVIEEVKKVPSGRSLYMGNINYYHKPLRQGKWAVTYEEWPEEDYPPYANGPGYIVTADIADFVVREFENHTLPLFKMEDVSMGMWVEQFNKSTPVEYVHSFNFCQYGCIEDYYTAHYQSPRQMMCMWDKLKRGKPQCCNMR